MGKLLCPSMMCADYGNLRSEMERLQEAGADIFHIDVMDGRYVPNFGMGLQDIEFLTKNATIPCDVHLMIMNPANYVKKFCDLGVKIMYVHPEADLHPARTLQMIRDCGVKSGIAINPGTSFETVEPLLPLCDYLLVMTVNPGFAGQKYVPSVDKKIDQLLAAKEEYGYEIMIDGACSPAVIERLNAKGVLGFILGTSALFNKGRSYKEIMPELRNL